MSVTQEFISKNSELLNCTILPTINSVKHMLQWMAYNFFPHPHESNLKFYF